MKKKKRCITLIEMMIVMFLIAMITGVIAYNYRGSLEEGKAFKTKTAQEKLHTILSLKQAEDPSFDIHRWQGYVKDSPYVHNADALLRDGWGEAFHVFVEGEDGAIVVESQGLARYEAKHGHRV